MSSVIMRMEVPEDVLTAIIAFVELQHTPFPETRTFSRTICRCSAPGSRNRDCCHRLKPMSQYMRERGLDSDIDGEILGRFGFQNRRASDQRRRSLEVGHA